MQKNLVIVESPAKAKTIEKFLGKDYKVLSSYGHIRDLKKKEFSIDVDKNFTPKYEIPAEKKKLVSELKEEAKQAETVWLASDEDREGEAISWHLFEVLKLKPEHTKRIVFHEITKTAIQKAIENPRNIDVNLVNAQQARRVLDRIVGFELSPVLWRKVKPALSAGRVQSVAVRLIVEREREINAFVSEPWYKVVANFIFTGEDGVEHTIKAELARRLSTKQEAEDFLKKCADATFTIESIETKPLKRYPAPPFTTSTLQQEAARKLGYSVSQTMMIAQHLYEAGYITYMRTDSVNLSTLALASSRDVIKKLMGDEYVETRNFTTNTKGAQEAHEAIRPTYMDNTEIEGNSQEHRLYELIWKRTIASQMASALIDKTTVTVSVNNTKEKFVATGEVVKFDGFLRVYMESHDDEEQSEDSGMLPVMSKGQTLAYKDITATQRFTQQPPRYTEASLVKKLEELGIGRPSTYAPTISTIQQREYVVKGDRPGEERKYDVIKLSKGKVTESQKTEMAGSDKGKLLPTDTGIVVNDYLTEYFPQIMDYNFTANIEKQFDEVAEGNIEWKSLMADFYKHFHPMVDNAISVKTEHKVGERILGNDPATGKVVSVKIGRFGPMVQLGAADAEEKPKFAQLGNGQSIETITLEEALDLFRLPRDLGDFEGKVITVSTGRFGPYVRYDGKFYSLPKDADPLDFTFDEAVALINAKRQEEANRLIKTFAEEPELEVLNGRYGPYISYKKKNYKLPKDCVPAELDLETCMGIIKEQDEKPASAKKGRYTKKK